MGKIRVAIIGLGERGLFSFGREIRKFPDLAEVTALADQNPVRLRRASEALQVDAGSLHTDYREVLRRPDVDAVIVTTPDWTHADVVCDAFAAGKAVFCEKPLATSVEGLYRIQDAQAKAGTYFQVGLNMRYGNWSRKIHDLIAAGEIGQVRMVFAKRFVEGGKYWHRWHKSSQYSGGLLVHKGTHFMDQLNWNAGARPLTVAATGGLDDFRPRPDAPPRCLDCGEKSTCREYLDINKGHLKDHYLAAEEHDGYIRDQCVYAPGADSFDNAIVMIQYENGVRGSYMECHFAPDMDGGSEIGAMGSEGHIIGNPATGSIVLTRRYSRKTESHQIVMGGGGHDGADEQQMQAFLHAMARGETPIADAEAGFYGAVIGLAAEHAARSGALVNIPAFIAR